MPDKPYVHHHVEIGLASTLLASSMPDAFLTYGGKFLFALFTTICMSILSSLVSNYMRKRNK